MGRKPRSWNPAFFYHIVSRGNRREALFLDVGDYKTFFYMLMKIHTRIPFELPCYCLMTNHYHLLMMIGGASHFPKKFPKICRKKLRCPFAG
ncbi:hypothetical protein CIB95_11810 [Lottiidibacillus patelloidae]|uniref:Uncharacterized protein n=1 Tax=Lottiidibacillus patelloidae TaxID=2670334 RepID=A0A263BRY5_9BACI|nr:transposase [Lottiidibacillus patelloidae]OZM56454.1 hypothetical protein CIB95_11810 [Lottiidibacillus patelloidae]